MGQGEELEQVSLRETSRAALAEPPMTDRLCSVPRIRVTPAAIEDGASVVAGMIKLESEAMTPLTTPEPTGASPSSNAAVRLMR